MSEYNYETIVFRDWFFNIFYMKRSGLTKDFLIQVQISLFAQIVFRQRNPTIWPTMIQRRFYFRFEQKRLFLDVDKDFDEDSWRLKGVLKGG